MGNPDLRRHVRYPANHVIRVCAFRGTLQETETARMLDVSQSGMSFVSTRYLAPGTKVRIEFEGCLLMGEIRHCRLREYGAQIEFVTGMQIQEVLEGGDRWQELTQSSG